MSYAEAACNIHTSCPSVASYVLGGGMNCDMIAMLLVSLWKVCIIEGKSSVLKRNFEGRA